MVRTEPERVSGAQGDWRSEECQCCRELWSKARPSRRGWRATDATIAIVGVGHE